MRSYFSLLFFFLRERSITPRIYLNNVDTSATVDFEYVTTN